VAEEANDNDEGHKAAGGYVWLTTTVMVAGGGQNGLQ